MDFEFRETQTAFTSGSQRARVWTEYWVLREMYCPACGARPLTDFPNNQPAADFFCASCREQFELKAKKTRTYGKKLADGAYATMMERLASDSVPSLMMMLYDREARRVRDLASIPPSWHSSTVPSPCWGPAILPASLPDAWIAQSSCAMTVGEKKRYASTSCAAVSPAPSRTCCKPGNAPGSCAARACPAGVGHSTSSPASKPKAPASSPLPRSTPSRTRSARYTRRITTSGRRYGSNCRCCGTRDWWSFWGGAVQNT